MHGCCHHFFNNKTDTPDRRKSPHATEWGRIRRTWVSFLSCSYTRVVLEQLGINFSLHPQHLSPLLWVRIFRTRQHTSFWVHVCLCFHGTQSTCTLNVVIQSFELRVASLDRISLEAAHIEGFSHLSRCSPYFQKQRPFLWIKFVLPPIQHSQECPCSRSTANLPYKRVVHRKSHEPSCLDDKMCAWSLQSELWLLRCRLERKSSCRSSTKCDS